MRIIHILSLYDYDNNNIGDIGGDNYFGDYLNETGKK